MATWYLALGAYVALSAAQVPLWRHVALAAVLALYLPVSRPEAVLTGTLASFLVYAVAVMWVFAARSAARAWMGLLIPGAALGALLLVHGYARSVT